MGENFDLGLGLAIGGCEFKPVFDHDNKNLQGKHKITLFPPQMKEKIRDREENVTSKCKGTDIKRPKVEASFAKDSSDSAGDDSSGGNVTRKKLRLTKEQSSLLDESFHMNQILSSKQKTELAQKLNLNPRQVEVWFQNRRARTKFKQTEVDCEVLKRWCENLTCENERLKRELLELRLIKARAASHNDQNFHASKAMKLCPLCEKIN